MSGLVAALERIPARRIWLMEIGALKYRPPQRIRKTSNAPQSDHHKGAFIAVPSNVPAPLR